MKGRSTRVPGHTLVRQGWGHHLDYATGTPLPNPVPGGDGRAVCTCGAFSPILPSQYKRNIWMRNDHKPEVIEGMEKEEQ